MARIPGGQGESESYVHFKATDETINCTMPNVE